MTAAWDPALYQRFGDHRLRPALDLLARVPNDGAATVVDLGCGTGTVTAHLAKRWPRATVIGVDSSPDMLTQARAAATGVTFVQADLATWEPDRLVDVVYSNAALHWLADHETLFPRLMDMLAPGGTLAVQMPLSWHEPSHRLMREALDELDLGSAGLRDSLQQPPVHEAAWYHDLVTRNGAAADVWTTIYSQILHGEDPVLAWVSGTGLRPVLADLDDGDRRRFLDRYRELLAAAYPSRPDQTVLYPFPRLFIIGIRSGESEEERTEGR